MMRNIAILLVVVVAAAVQLAVGQQVGFMMTRGRREGTYINFEVTATNVNAELSQEVGAFRCSEPGLYQFSFSAMPPRHSLLKVSLRKNRVPVTTLFAAEGSHTTVTGSIVLWLMNNDIVYPFVEEGDIQESVAKTRALTSFSGVRISSKHGDDSPLNSMFRSDFVTDAVGIIGQPDESDHIDKLFQVSKPQSQAAPSSIGTTESSVTTAAAAVDDGL